MNTNINLKGILISIMNRFLITAYKIRYGYYYSNYMEKKENQKILKKNRLKNNEPLKEPLVSVLIPTYNRSKLLTERSIPSVLRQTYQNIEIIVVGDHCTDDTEDKIKELKDKRIKFYNLPERTEYPSDPYHRWMVAGAKPSNEAIKISSGQWIAPLDDDDEFTDDHIEILLKFALKNDYELVYGKVEMEIEPEKWVQLGCYPLQVNHISHMSVLYSSKLKFMKYDRNSWKYMEVSDWNMWRRMREAGAKIGFINKIVGKHYLEHQQAE
ncbi:MAG: glycosyltransferase family 2 protein [Methanobacterium sp.]